MRDAPWPGTHNSFNSNAEMGAALSAKDSNQQLTLVDQLRLGVRSLELDVHYWLGRPTVCHAQSNHEGCTIEKPLAEVLPPIAAACASTRARCCSSTPRTTSTTRPATTRAPRSCATRLGVAALHAARHGLHRAAGRADARRHPRRRRAGRRRQRLRAGHRLERRRPRVVRPPRVAPAGLRGLPVLRPGLHRAPSTTRGSSATSRTRRSSPAARPRSATRRATTA